MKTKTRRDGTPVENLLDQIQDVLAVERIEDVKGFVEAERRRLTTLRKTADSAWKGCRASELYGGDETAELGRLRVELAAIDAKLQAGRNIEDLLSKCTALRSLGKSIADSMKPAPPPLTAEQLSRHREMLALGANHRLRMESRLPMRVLA